MKTAISLPDDLFERGEAYSRESGKSRSELYRDALDEYLRRRDAALVTAEMNLVVDASKPEADEWLGAAGRRVFKRSEW